MHANPRSEFIEGNLRFALFERKEERDSLKRNIFSRSCEPLTVTC